MVVVLLVVLLVVVVVVVIFAAVMVFLDRLLGRLVQKKRDIEEDWRGYVPASIARILSRPWGTGNHTKKEREVNRDVGERESRGERHPNESAARTAGSTRLTTHSTTLGVSLISNTSAVSTRAWGGTPSLQHADKKLSMFSI